MKMLLCRPAGKRANGDTRRVPVVRTRGRKYGPVLEDKTLSVRRDLLITGPNASGKSRWLGKLAEKADEVWPGRELLYLRATEPLQRWHDDPRVIAHAQAAGKEWGRLRAYERVDWLLKWVAESKVVLLLDDAHKLAARKLDLAIQLCRSATQLVIGAWAEQSLPMSLRMLVDKRDPQRVALASEAAYDVTGMTLWILIIIAVGSGWWQLAAVLGGMKVLAGGRRAARQA